MTSAGEAALSAVQVTDIGPGVVEVVLARVEALNALSGAFAAQIATVVGALESRRDLRAVVLSSGTPRAFCVGADLKERSRLDDAGIRAQRVHLKAAFAAIRGVAVPVVVAVDGFALGGGLELALSGDLIVAAQDAVLGLPEVSVGVIPGGGGTQLLARRVGYARAADLIFTARRVTGAEAFALGVVDRLAVPGQARASAVALAAQIAENSPVCLREAKRALGAALGVSLAEGLQVEESAWLVTASSEDRREGVAAFVEKRKPVWPGR